MVTVRPNSLFWDFWGVSRMGLLQFNEPQKMTIYFDPLCLWKPNKSTIPSWSLVFSPPRPSWDIPGKPWEKSGSTLWFFHGWNIHPLWTNPARTEIMKQQTTFPPAERKSGGLERVGRGVFGAVAMVITWSLPGPVQRNTIQKGYRILYICIDHGDSLCSLNSCHGKWQF